MKKIISLGLLFLLTISVSAQEVYQKEVFISSRGDSLKYRLLRPERGNRKEVSACSFSTWWGRTG